jgi:hypothetical protein
MSALLFGLSRACLGATADLVRRQLQRQQAEVFGIRVPETPEPEIETEPGVSGLPEVVIPPVRPIPAVVTQLRVFDMSSDVLQRRRCSHRSPAACALSNQLGLFGN